MRYAGWVAMLNTRNADGTTPRDDLVVIASRPDAPSYAYAQRMLDGPPFPEPLLYLWRYLLEIRKGLGVGFHGLNELSWVALQAWTTMRKVGLDPEEADALVDLDRVMRDPESLGELAWT